MVTGIDEPEVDLQVDFTQYATGAIDRFDLEERYHKVEEQVQEVVHFNTLRQMVQASRILKQAIDDEDAVAVGRILTWAEETLAE